MKRISGRSSSGCLSRTGYHLGKFKKKPKIDQWASCVGSVDIKTRWCHLFPGDCWFFRGHRGQNPPAVTYSQCPMESLTHCVCFKRTVWRTRCVVRSVSFFSQTETISSAGIKAWIYLEVEIITITGRVFWTGITFSCIVNNLTFNAVCFTDVSHDNYIPTVFLNLNCQMLVWYNNF